MSYPDNSRALEQVGTWDPPEDYPEFGIVDARVDWMEKWDLNAPVLQILVEKVFNISDFRYKKLEGDPGASFRVRNATLYWAEIDGQVSYFAHNKTDEKGIGGRVFRLSAEDPSVDPYIIAGPWSSSSSSMNNYFDHTTEASLIDELDGYKRGYTFYSSAVTIPMALEALDLIYENTGESYVLAQYKRYSEYSCWPLVVAQYLQSPYEIVRLENSQDIVFKRDIPNKYNLLYPRNLYHDLFECPEEDNELSNGGYDL
jgi:hypothetical protein